MKKFTILAVALSIIIVLSLAKIGFANTKSNFDDILNAIHQVETGGLPNNGENAIGDNGDAIGPFQIHYAYWKDSGIPGNYEQCNGFKYSQRVVKAYLKRYAPKAVANGNAEVLARIHNGGPTGYKRSTTLGYWKKVEEALGS